MNKIEIWPKEFIDQVLLPIDLFHNSDGYVMVSVVEPYSRYALSPSTTLSLTFVLNYESGLK